MNRRHAAAAALFLLLPLLSACGGAAESSSVEFRVPVRVAPVGTDDVEDLVVTTGSLRVAESVALTTETAGLLSVARVEDGRRRLAEGDLVRKGQVIATVSGEEVRLAARSEATRERFETALRDHDSKQRLFDEGLISEQELAQAVASLAEARIEYERSQYTESRTQLSAPLDGAILRLARDEQGQPLADGQRVTAGFLVASIAPLDRLIADVDVLGPDVARVRPGQLVRLRHQAWNDRIFTGRVARLAPSIDPQTRALRVEVEIDNRDRLLRPGMFIEASIVTEHREGVPVVPRAAVTERSGRKVVFVLRGQRVAQREVGLGLGDDEIVELLSGVEEGEKVVVKGLETLTDESRVRVVGG